MEVVYKSSESSRRAKLAYYYRNRDLVRKKQNAYDAQHREYQRMRAEFNRERKRFNAILLE